MMLFVWLMLASLILLLTPQKMTSKVQFAFIDLFKLPLSIGRNITLSTRTQQAIKGGGDTQELIQLKNHLANVTELVMIERQKVQQLSGLRSRFPLEGAKLVLADVIPTSRDAVTKRLVINRGQKDGLALGQFVLANNGVIGKISRVFSRTAEVSLIIDSSTTIAVKISPAGCRSVMQGNGKNAGNIAMIPRKYKIKKGNVVYAEKKPGFLDSPMIAGTISDCKISDSDPLLWDITVSPVCDIETLTNVAVIIMNPQ